MQVLYVIFCDRGSYAFAKNATTCSYYILKKVRFSFTAKNKIELIETDHHHNLLT